MASDSEPCCGHDHVGGDELWMTRDEIREMIRDELRELTSAGGQPAAPAAAGKPAAPGTAPAAVPAKAPAKAPAAAPRDRLAWLDRPVGRRSRTTR